MAKWGRPGRQNDVRLNAISDGYLRTMGVELLSGRDFTPKDSATPPPIALVNPSFARRLGIVGNPVGARFRAEGPSPSGTVYEIVGLVADTKYFGLREEFLPIVFVPVAQIDDPRPFTDFVIRSSLPLAGLSSAVRGRLRRSALPSTLRFARSTPPSVRGLHVKGLWRPFLRSSALWPC